VTHWTAGGKLRLFLSLANEWQGFAMDQPQFFELAGEHAVFHPSGEAPLRQVVEMISSAIQFAREQSILKLLVVTTGLTGFESPGVIDRYYFIKEWARAANSAVRVALVASPRHIDREKFGVTVARNIGFYADVFASEEEAIRWLNSRPPLQQP
jgi:hypothetical protein